ncbi:stalk domain-containing protein [Paenibacillus rhizophilus]|uniref:Copper amine oxidase-like N-terminal domain-containing protein n=1 Tax=Paenibacillus rhizophilus TaxID=1850366 RepID=A0A3N9P3N3_9BACL|nr:hypothetical protein [Paenibacillus rhizophilus]RQW10047.1 hypothetical protein EH198_16565 [Paenibacillus rhizophilus]
MKKIVASFIAGALVMVSVQAFGDSVSQIGKKIQTEYTVTVDGQKLTVPAIAVDGKSYAPVRVIGEAAGYNVSVSGKTVVLNKKEEQNVTTQENTVISTTTSQTPSTNTSQIEELKRQAIKLHGEIVNLAIEGNPIYIQLLRDRNNAELKSKYEDYEKRINELKAQYDELEKQIEALQAQ